MPGNHAAREVGAHRAAVRELLLRHLPARVETLRVSAEAMTAAPARYRDRLLAETVFAPADQPRFDNAQMDGYAVRVADLRGDLGGGPLPVAAAVPAGTEPEPLPPGAVAAVMTGAVVPAGADAVVPIERASPDRFFPAGTADARVALPPDTPRGQFVRPRGDDVRAGETLLAAGVRLTPPRWAVLAAAGVERVTVRARPRVLVVTTGLELRPPGTELGPGQVHDANAPLLLAALAECGVEARALRLESDEPALLAGLLEAEPDVELLITSGGVSAGAHEVVRETLAGRGVEFLHVAMQPGGPQGLGLVDGRLPAVCFPGNPVSTAVSFEVFLRPVLRELAGLSPAGRAVEYAPLTEDIDSPAGREQFRRGSLEPDGSVRPVGGAGSHLLHALARSSALIRIPAGTTSLAARESVEVWRIDD